jgi:putative transposase
MKKSYSPEFKAKVVLELLKEELTPGQLSAKYQVHLTQINRWKKAVIEGMPELLADNRKRDTLVKEHEEEKKELFAQIGELSTKLAW